MTDSLSRRSILRGAAGAAILAGAVGMTPAGAEPSTEDFRRRFRVPKEKISIQLWTLRRILATDLEGTLEALADIGYRKVELAGLHGRTAAEFRAILDRVGIRATSTHVSIDGDIDQLIADARTLGHKYVVHPFAQFATIAEWQAFVERLERAGAAFRRAGFQFGYHNHAHEFTPIDGVRPWDLITRGTTRKNVHLEVDLYWAVTGGADPIRLFWENFGRVKQYHVKDRAPDGSFADPGTGTIDFPRIFRANHVQEVDEYIVENDEPADALVTAEIGYEYLRNLRF
ncbi:MAG TPA: sugar phosphate isomerase/epimerase [Actinophytocola sp.]|uniref:sugar phosphate isomerase/epimerase family protein n=1 Tax=Actinophytocola sp. TaxID=1872138 RepID=UPI002DDD00A9|nr:sugar phosphate isomerase/epimerase [Actinophytocola sp.]HEV2779297.1 sugar phosphate isomerase/epimerase [Actinophytocola sp.]